jgi:hypothetical protein
MKKIILFACIGFLAFACRQEAAIKPMHFKGFSGNPILVPGAPGSWDDMYVINAFELIRHDTIFMFYTAYSQKGSRALGLATSTDGYNFTKFGGNPILEGDGSGYNAFGVAQAHVLGSDTGWVLYFNAREIVGFSCGQYIGRARAKSLTGPWIPDEDPVLTTGKKGEWDSDFLYLGPVLMLENHTYRMYYAGGDDLVSSRNFYIGMSTSMDGIRWEKYNDPATTQHPFADSDPVLMTGGPGAWDDGVVLTGTVLQNQDGYAMYYHGADCPLPGDEKWTTGSIGFATSRDCIHWKKYRNNPVYSLKDDPFSMNMKGDETIIQSPKLLFTDSLCFMYYDYGHGINNGIGVAVCHPHP